MVVSGKIMPLSPRKSSRTLSEINVTPLVDVMLVLLIIFMVATPMLHRGLSVNLPRTESKPLKAEEVLIITITKDKIITLGKTPLILSDLEERLEKIATAQPDRPIYLRADKDLSYGFVIQVMAAIRKAGIQNLGMVTELPQSNEVLKISGKDPSSKK